MKTVTITQKLAEEIIDQLEGAQKDFYVQSTENVISELRQALRKPTYAPQPSATMDKELQKLINEHMPKKYYGHEARRYIRVIARLYAEQQVKLLATPAVVFSEAEVCQMKEKEICCPNCDTYGKAIEKVDEGYVCHHCVCFWPIKKREL